MTTTTTIDQQVRECKESHPKWGRARIAANLGLPCGTVRYALERLRGVVTRPSARAQTTVAKEETREGLTIEKNKDGTAIATSVSRNIRTLEELLKYAEVDTNEYEVERFVINKYEMGSKGSDDKIVVTPLYQVKAWLRRREKLIQARDLLKDVLEAFKSASPPGKPIRYPKIRDGHMLEVSVFDLHLGKLCWSPEVGNNYDAKIAETAFETAVVSLLRKTQGFNVEKVLFPIGNDFFNVDNARQTTTAGTPQDEDGRWQRSFVAGRKMMVRAINMLREVAPVRLVMVAGNHDTERLFYLGDALEGWFHNAAGVEVDNSPMQRKYYEYHNVLLGFTHGDKEKMKDLPLIMASEQPQSWARTKYREFHLGHWHIKNEIHFQPVAEYEGIRVRIIPSLCPPDAWHKSKGYNNLRAAEAYLWHPENGFAGMFSFSPSYN